MHQAAVPMDAEPDRHAGYGCRRAGEQPTRMVSGAGHDAMMLAERMQSCMLFLRSPGGLSHHPDETVLAEDVEAALAVGLEFLNRLIAG